ncbi:hypothetical protein EMN47_15495 [Prolixibacteraceae bacterium JC049]|nr:hypothetical protein [Prolixibacteraceae bacterium JC049]
MGSDIQSVLDDIFFNLKIIDYSCLLLWRVMREKISKYISTRFNAVSAIQLFQLVRYGILFLIGIVLVKAGVAKADIGYYEQFLFLAGAVSFFWINGFIKGFLSLHNSAKSGIQLFNAFIALQLFAVLGAGALAATKDTLFPILLSDHSFSNVTLLVVYVVLTAPASLVEYILYLKDKSKELVGYGIWAYGIQLIAIGMAAFAQLDVEKLLLILVATGVLRYGYLLWLLAKHGKFQFDSEFLKDCLNRSWPLIAAALLSGSAQYIDGFIITSRFSAEEFAIFRYGARELPLALLLANSFSNAMVAKVNTEKPQSEVLQEIYQGSKRLIYTLFPMSLVLALLSHQLFKLFFNPDFAESATIFNIYLLLVVSRLVFPQAVLIGLGHTKLIMRASFWELMLNVTLSLLLVRTMGVSGVALATVIAYWFEKLYLSFRLRKDTGIALQQIVPLGSWLIGSLILCAVVYVIEWM